MSYPDVDTPMYYSEDYDYSIYYQNELKNYQTPAHTTSTLNAQNPQPVPLPTINYLNERKCPIYIHQIRNDSSVFNNYNQKFINSNRPMAAQNVQKPDAQNASKFVLDKLEETYWATWKPKKDSGGLNTVNAKKVASFGYSEDKSAFQKHYKVAKKESNRPHGDASDNIIKFFKAKHFDSKSTTNSAHETTPKKSNSLVPKRSDVIKTKKDPIVNETTRKMRINKEYSISQEIQTEVHCPVILEESKENDRIKEDQDKLPVLKNIEESELDNEEKESCECNRNHSEEIEKPAKSPKQKRKGKKQPKESKQLKKESQKVTPVITKVDDNSDSIDNFVEHKDSIEITKKKQDQMVAKKHVQQPKCIRLYRKSGLPSGYIKGGTYPLKSCLKQEVFPNGNFRLGAPGSPLFVTTSSFSNRRRK